MSGVRGVATTTEIALTAATAKTVIQLVAASNHRVLVTGWGVFFDGTSTVGEPAQVRVLKQTTAGTMSSLTPVKLNASDDETLQTTAQHTATAEPTAGDVYDVIECHPQQGYEKMLPPGMELVIVGGQRMGIEVTAPAAVNVRAKMFFNE